MQQLEIPVDGGGMSSERQIVRPGELPKAPIQIFSKCENSEQRCYWLEPCVPFCNRYAQTLKRPNAHAVRLELCILHGDEK